VHPGEVLLEEFLQPMGVSQYRLARTINVPARRINEIVVGKRGISPDTASRLARAFGTSDRFSTNLQTRYDLEWVAEAKGDELDRIVPLPSA
jgi:addiction module HigA family antidote